MSDARDQSARLDPAGTSEHDQRNRSQLEALKQAADRRRHRAYIDAMLQKTTSGRLAESAHRETAADEEDAGSGS